MRRLPICDRLSVGARDAAEAISTANHAIVAGVIELTDAYDVVGHLDDLVHRLPQLVGYLARTAERAHAADYFDDRGTDPATTADDAAQALRAALGGLDATAGHLVTAHNALGHLGRHTPED